MFKRYQQAGVEEEATFKERAPVRPSAPQPPLRTRPYLKEPLTEEPPPRMSESMARAPLTPPPVAPPSNSFEEESTWQEPVALSSEEPETTLGEGVTFKGELSFQRLLRIDGHFEGKLTSSGKLLVGPKGVLKSEDIQLREAIIEGVVEGNLKVEERVELRGEAVVRGNIEAQSLSIDEGVSVVGHISVLPAGASASIESDEE